MLSVIINSFSHKNLENILFNLKKNECIKQIIFIGPRIKNNYLHRGNIEIMYIQSFEKPTICINTALRKVNQEYVIFYTNDLYLNIDNGIDYLLKKQTENPKKIFSCVYTIEKKLVYDFQKININNKNINLPFAPLIKMEDIKKFNYIDDLFISSFWDIDLYLKLIFFDQKEVEYTFVSLDEDKNIAKTSGLFSYYGYIDKIMLQYKWSSYFISGNLKKSPKKIYNGHWISKNKFFFFLLNMKLVRTFISKLVYLNVKKSDFLHHQ